MREMISRGFAPIVTYHASDQLLHVSLYSRSPCDRGFLVHVFEASLGVVRTGVRRRSVARGSKTAVVRVGARQVERKDREGGELKGGIRMHISLTSLAPSYCFSPRKFDGSPF